MLEWHRNNKEYRGHVMLTYAGCLLPAAWQRATASALEREVREDGIRTSAATSVESHGTTQQRTAHEKLKGRLVVTRNLTWPTWRRTLIHRCARAGPPLQQWSFVQAGVQAGGPCSCCTSGRRAPNHRCPPYPAARSTLLLLAAAAAAAPHGPLRARSHDGTGPRGAA